MTVLYTIELTKTAKLRSAIPELIERGYNVQIRNDEHSNYLFVLEPENVSEDEAWHNLDVIAETSFSIGVAFCGMESVVKTRRTAAYAHGLDIANTKKTDEFFQNSERID